MLPSYYQVVAQSDESYLARGFPHARPYAESSRSGWEYPTLVFSEPENCMRTIDTPGAPGSLEVPVGMQTSQPYRVMH